MRAWLNSPPRSCQESGRHPPWQAHVLQRQMALADAYAGDVMARNMMDEDAAEGIDAFLQKRAPRWRGLA